MALNLKILSVVFLLITMFACGQDDEVTAKVNNTSINKILDNRKEEKTLPVVIKLLPIPK